MFCIIAENNATGKSTAILFWKYGRFHFLDENSLPGYRSEKLCNRILTEMIPRLPDDISALIKNPRVIHINALNDSQAPKYEYREGFKATYSVVTKEYLYIEIKKKKNNAGIN